VKLKSVSDLIRFYIAQHITGFIVPAEPHFDEPTKQRFLEELRAARLYLEYGSGGSTRVANGLGVQTISVENDRFFARALRRSLGDDSNGTVLDARIGFTRQWGRPLIKLRSARRLRRWTSYVQRPWSIIRQIGRFPDFVLVDGRFRRACALETARRAIEMDQSTVLMFDDYFTPGNQHYHSVEAILGSPERVGRSAVFAVSPASVVRAPSVEDVASATRDPE
jgi:hypothetical protein